MTTEHTPRVLVLRALGLGDLLAGVPALRGIRRAFPGHQVVLAQPPGLTELALATGAVDTVFPAEAPGRAVPDLGHWPGPPPRSPSTCTATDPRAATRWPPCARAGCSRTPARTARPGR